MTSVTGVKRDLREVQRELKEFTDRETLMNQRNVAASNWHRDLYLSKGVKLPYNTNTTSCYNTVRATDDDENSPTYGEYVIDVDATNREIARVIQFARHRGYKVTKDYNDDSFKVSFTMMNDGTPYVEDPNSPDKYVRYDERITFTYVYDRKSVCTKRVTGTQVVPARVEEIVEWDCDPISFSAMDTSE